MSLNSENNGEFAGWNDQAPGSDSPTPGHAPGEASGLLANLFRLNSMVSDNRNLKEVAETHKILTENIYKNATSSTTDENQRKIVPTVEFLTPSIANNLPGLGFYCEVGDTMYVMAVLFSNKHLSIGTEHITVNTGIGAQQRVSIPITPSAQINKQFVERLKEHYTRFAQGRGKNEVIITNLLVQDMEMLAHPEAGEPKDYAHNIAVYLASEWEESIMVLAAQAIVKANQRIPSPFLEPNSPYGKDNCAEARVTAVSGRVNKGKVLIPANMEVIVTTINNQQQQNYNYNPANSREIARVLATVSLTGVSWEEYQQQMAALQGQDQMAHLQRFMGINALQQSPWPGTYRPLRPQITIESVHAGEMLHNNGGLYPFFFGLYALMTTNNQYVFADALRKQHVGGRGSLVGLETRIQMMTQNIPGVNVTHQNRTVLNDKNINDTDVVNAWVRQNIAPHATFQINLVPNGPNAAIIQFMQKLVAKNADAIKTVIGLIDGMSKNKFSEIIRENMKNERGWNPNKPILIPTNAIAVNGLATSHEKIQINTQEVDEMFICNAKGNNQAGKAAIENYLGIQYGNNLNEDFKQRSQKLRIEHSSSLFDGQVHINGFGQPCIWAPDFMAALGAAMDSIGTMNVANNLGSFRSDRLAFAPGFGLATVVGAGNNNNGVTTIGSVYNLANPVY